MDKRLIQKRTDKQAQKLVDGVNKLREKMTSPEACKKMGTTTSMYHYYKARLAGTLTSRKSKVIVHEGTPAKRVSMRAKQPLIVNYGMQSVSPSGRLAVVIGSPTDIASVLRESGLL